MERDPNHTPDPIEDEVGYPEIKPNAVTIAAMEEADDTRVSFRTIAALMADLHADD